MTNRELERARHIQQCLDTLRPGLLEKYSDRLKGAPAQVMDNGLLQTLAFFYSKKKDLEYVEIANHITGWLKQCGLLTGPDPIRGIVDLDSTQYRQCSEEAIAWLNWAKRLALARVAMATSR